MGVLSVFEMIWQVAGGRRQIRPAKWAWKGYNGATELLRVANAAKEEYPVNVPHEYVENLPAIYRDLLAAFPQFDSTRKVGYGLSFQSLYSALEGK